MYEQPKHDTQLLTVRQRKEKLLKQFIDRFNKENLKVYDLDKTVAITAFYLGVQNIKCASLFHRNQLRTLVELTKRVRKYIDTEEFLKTKTAYQADEGPFRSKYKQEA